MLAELSDHAACAREAALRDGGDPDAAERAAIGNLEALRRALEAVEPAFRITRRHAFVRGVIGAVLVAFVIDRIGLVMYGVIGSLAALAIAAACAPRGWLELLRAELRAPRVRGTLVRGRPIGAALTYAFTVAWAPVPMWIALIVMRAVGGITEFETPASAFAVMVAAGLVLLVEAIRARRSHGALA